MRGIVAIEEVDGSPMTRVLQSMQRILARDGLGRFEVISASTPEKSTWTLFTQEIHGAADQALKLRDRNNGYDWSCYVLPTSIELYNEEKNEVWYRRDILLIAQANSIGHEWIYVPLASGDELPTEIAVEISKVCNNCIKIRDRDKSLHTPALRSEPDGNKASQVVEAVLEAMSLFLVSSGQA